MTDSQLQRLRIALCERMGWTDIRTIRDDMNPRIHPASRTKTLRGIRPDGRGGFALPNPLTSPADALALAEWMRAEPREMSFSCDNISEGEYEAYIYPKDVPGRTIIATAPTFPLALSLAAAKALNIPIE